MIASLTFMRDEHGRPISWLGQFQDVTEHRALAERDMLTQLTTGAASARRWRRA